MNKSKAYFLCITWGGTRQNHAGMVYLLSKIREKYPDMVIVIKTPSGIGNWHSYFKKIWLIYITFLIRFLLRQDDKLILMEYLGVGAGDQTKLALKLRSINFKGKIYGMVHLSGEHLMELYGNVEYIRKGAEAVDKIIVLGSTLKYFFDALVSINKIIKTFHYVDNQYYKPSDIMKSDKLQVIHIGTHKRNFELLKEIVGKCGDIDFHIFQGKHDLSLIFDNIPNVKLYRYLPENTVLKIMQQSHVSLSVLYDTIGSNVINTSMACGLVNVVSNVGSIRDYCSESESILCNNSQEFVSALNTLDNDRMLLEKLSNRSFEKSKDFSIEKSIDFFYNEIIK